MPDTMTDHQLFTILKMIRMILDGCENLEEAKEKLKKLMES